MRLSPDCHQQTQVFSSWPLGRNREDFVFFLSCHTQPLKNLRTVLVIGVDHTQSSVWGRYKGFTPRIGRGCAWNRTWSAKHLQSKKGNIQNWLCYQSNLSVKDPLVGADDVLITEEQVEVLEGLRQEERLLHVVLVSTDLGKEKVILRASFGQCWKDIENLKQKQETKHAEILDILEKKYDMTYSLFPPTLRKKRWFLESFLKLSG